jgi:site-specific DNA-methyltransferase (adenine-specific)
MQKEQIGDMVLYKGDCLDVLQSGELNGIGAVVCDPPYGQKQKVNTFYAGGSRSKAVVQRNGKTIKVNSVLHSEMHGDDIDFDPFPWLNFAPEIIMWGAHKFADRLPPGGWLVWDKVPTGKHRDQGDGEAAWINRDMPMRIYRLLWDGLCVGSGARHEVTAGQKRMHPTQKPEILMRWCLGFIKSESVLDPYMGSGSTGVACIELGKRFVGIEMKQAYFDIACRRLDLAWKNRPRLFEGVV